MSPFSSWILLVIAIPFLIALPNDLPLSVISHGGYVRSAQLPDKSLLACNSATNEYISIYKQNPNNSTWNLLSKLENPSSPNTANTDFTNCFLYSSININNFVLLAARYHTGCNGVDCKYYSIRIWVSNDNGITWNGGTGYIVDSLSYSTQSNSNCGLWEPFIYEINDNLNIYYAKEYLDFNHHKQQNIIQKTSQNIGVTWNNPIIVSSSGSRDGMPSVTQFIDGTVLCSMETAWPIDSGHFTTSIIKSYDGGNTYLESSRQFIFNANTPYQTSASGIAYSNKTGIIIVTSILDNGLDKTNDNQYIIYSDSVDGYHWNSFTLVTSNHGFWPNVYLFNDDLYIQFDSNGMSYYTQYPINRIPNQYIAYENNINRIDSDINYNGTNVNTSNSYDCYINCLYLNNEECIGFKWNMNGNCCLKNGINNYNLTQNVTSNILSSRWYYGTNTDAVLYKMIENISNKDDCLFECLFVGENNCKHVIWNDQDNKCYLKSTLPTTYIKVSWNTWLWIVPQLTVLNRGIFISNLNGDIMNVDKYGMKIYNHINNELIANVPRWLVYNANFTWNFEWGIVTMQYIQNSDSWNELGAGNAIWKRNASNLNY